MNYNCTHLHLGAGCIENMYNIVAQLIIFGSDVQISVLNGLWQFKKD